MHAHYSAYIYIYKCAPMGSFLISYLSLMTRPSVGRLLTLTEVACTIDTVDEETMSQIITIKIIAFPEVPYENNVYSHTGNPPLSYFKCETQKIDRELSTDPYCDIEDVVNGMVKDSI